MSLQFIFGNSGAGKSRYLYDSIIKASMEEPQVNYIVLVPEQFTVQTQKELCIAHPRHGIMNIDVLSFVRLSHRIFEEVGGNTKRILDDEGKNLILRKVAGDCQEELKVLRGNLKKQGYISEVKSVISEFTQYGLDYVKLRKFLETMDNQSSLYYKLRDLCMVYEKFEERLAEQYITKEEILDLLSDVVPQSAVLRGSVVALDGFTGFTPVQNRLLRELMRVCARVIITVEMDEREDPFVYRHPYQLFALSKQTVTSLVQIAEEQRIEIEEPVCLYKNPAARFRQNPPLAFLERELFRFGRGQYSEKQEAVSVHVAKNPKEEAEFVAAKIRFLLRAKGYRCRDVAVIVSDMETYAVYLEKAFALYEIPVFIDHKKSILLNAFVEYVRSLLAMAEQSFTYESVFRFLRTGMTGFSIEEVDRMENYVLAAGLRGYRKWKETWVRRIPGMDADEMETLNLLRRRFVEKLDALMKVLQKRKKTVLDITRGVYEFFVQEQMQEKLREQEQKFQEEGELSLAKEYAQIYRIVIDLFDKFAELLGEEEISLKEYCELLDAGLEEAKVGIIPPSLDQVVVGDMERTRLTNPKVLFFVGANDVYLPGETGQKSLLTARDREYFEKRKVVLSPGAKEKMYIQKFYLYMNLTKPSKGLYLSFSKAAQNGKAMRPAYLIQDLLSLYPGMKVQEEEMRPLLEQEIQWEQAEQYLAEGLRDRERGINDTWKELYTCYKKQGGREERFLDAAFYQRGAGRLTRQTAKALFGDINRVSVTRLEQFASCAYAHFLTYGLKLTERMQYQFSSLDLGNIAHQSMERFSRKADSLRLVWTKMTEEQRAGLIEESVEESIVDYGNTVLYSTARDAYGIICLKNLVSRSIWAITKQMEPGDFIPSGYELKFGSGKIDRIDTCEDAGQILVKVTDYKTGKKKFSISSFYHGIQLQLPVYMNAALDSEHKKHEGAEVIPAGIFYYRMQDPFVEKEGDKQKQEELLLEALRQDGLINSNERVISHLERNLDKKSILYPMKRNNDGSFSKTSKMLTQDEFFLFLEYTKKKEEELKQRIASGEAAVSPYELGRSTGCDYCNYRAVCGFDLRLPECAFRRLSNYSREEVMERIRKEMEDR